MPSIPKALRHAGMVAVIGLFLTGCQTAMTAPSSPDHLPPPPQTFSVPLRFDEHNFSTYCYNAHDCQVIYNNRGFFSSATPHEKSGWFPPPSSPDYRKNWNASHAGISNFPAPAEVRWRSLDGTELHAFVDIGRIFAEQLIWHQVDAAEIVHTFIDYTGAPCLRGCLQASFWKSSTGPSTCIWKRM